MCARIGAIGNAITIDIEVAPKILARFERFGCHYLASIQPAIIVPHERLAQPLVHAYIEIEHDKNRRLQPVRKVERLGPEGETLVWILGKQQHMFGVTV